MSPLLEPPRISIFTFLFFAQYSLQAEDCTGPLKPVIWERTQNQGSSHHGYWPAYSVFILDETDKKLANGDHNYWLAQVGHTTGQGFTVMVDDCTRLIAGVQIKNLGNGFASRGYATKEFRISGSKNQSGPWETLVEDWLVDTSGVSRAAALLNYTFDKPIEIQYIRFDLVSFWELGGGLQYFAAIPASSGPAAETTTDSAIGTATAVEVTSSQESNNTLLIENLNVVDVVIWLAALSGVLLLLLIWVVYLTFKMWSTARNAIKRDVDYEGGKAENEEPRPNSLNQQYDYMG